MSRRGRYKKFCPNFEPDPWHTDGSDSDIGNQNINLNESVTKSPGGPDDDDVEEALDNVPRNPSPDQAIGPAPDDDGDRNAVGQEDIAGQDRAIDPSPNADVLQDEDVLQDAEDLQDRDAVGQDRDIGRFPDAEDLQDHDAVGQDRDVDPADDLQVQAQGPGDPNGDVRQHEDAVLNLALEGNNNILWVVNSSCIIIYD